MGQNWAKRRKTIFTSIVKQPPPKKLPAQAASLSAAMAEENPSVRKFQALVQMNTLYSSAPLTRNNVITVFTKGRLKFDALVECIREAKEHVHLLYYKMGSDALGQEIIRALIAKAEQGVSVRLIYDDVGTPRSSNRLFNELRQAGGEVSPYFPSRIHFLNLKVNFRNHRKIAVIDGKIGFIGGFNVGEEYVGLSPKIGNWRDTHLMISGNAVYSLQAQFLQDWKVCSRQNISSDPAFYPKVEAEGRAAVQIVSSGPDVEEQHIKDSFIKIFFEARESILLQSPYFLPDDSLINALKIAALSGVEVKVMIPRKGNHFIVQWASYAYLGELLRAGVKCYLYNDGFLHAKTIVVDGQAASVGTANMDPRSFRLNFEINAFVYDAGVASQLEAAFVKDVRSSSFTPTWIITSGRCC